MEEIKVSIITPVYNAEKWIRSTIESVIAQSHKNWEHILVDDCSTDQSFDLMKKIISDDDRFILIKNIANKGPAYSRNTAINMASGKYLAFLDADDIWDSLKLTKQIQFMEKNNLAISHHCYGLISEVSSIPKGVIRGSDILNYSEFHKSRGIGYCLTFMVNMEISGRPVFPTDPIFRIAEDFLAFSPIIRMHESKLLDEPLGAYRIIVGSRSSNKIRAALTIWNVYFRKEGLGFFRSSWYWTFYIFNSLRLQFKIKKIMSDRGCE
jgi:teichuronic acid biosynthesis glycosyltransferase TuaG